MALVNNADGPGPQSHSICNTSPRSLEQLKRSDSSEPAINGVQTPNSNSGLAESVPQSGQQSDITKGHQQPEASDQQQTTPPHSESSLAGITADQVSLDVAMLQPHAETLNHPVGDVVMSPARDRG